MLLPFFRLYRLMKRRKKIVESEKYMWSRSWIWFASDYEFSWCLFSLRCVFVFFFFCRTSFCVPTSNGKPIIFRYHCYKWVLCLIYYPILALSEEKNKVNRARKPNEFEYYIRKKGKQCQCHNCFSLSLSVVFCVSREREKEKNWNRTFHCARRNRNTRKIEYSDRPVISNRAFWCNPLRSCNNFKLPS